MPDYQGIGLGTKLLDFMGNYLKAKGYMCSINTTAKNLIFSLRKSPKWSMRGYTENKVPARFRSNGKIVTVKKDLARIGVKKASFMFK